MKVDKQVSEILIVEDSEELSAAYCAYLKDQPYRISIVETGKDALQFLEDNNPAVMLLDLMLPDIDGLDILSYIEANAINTQVIVITGHGSVELAVESMRKGAFDFITKPVDANRLKTTLRNAVQKNDLHGVIDLYKESYDRDRYHGFIGKSSSMQAVYQTIDRVAPSYAPVFITGESGTGKELCAEAIHKQGNRSEQPFIALNCAAIPEELIESEMFGHVKGAFTGASSDREGAAKLADGGTLFLDEICEMNPLLQSKLLRFIQTGIYKPVGSDKEIKADIRFISATNKDPLIEVSNGRFREDLYYRLHVIPVHMPPLRDRGQDILLMASHLLNKIASEEGKSFDRFTDEASKLLMSYSWPGNVRNLQNVLRTVVLMNTGNIVDHLMLQQLLIQSGNTMRAVISDEHEQSTGTGSINVNPVSASNVTELKRGNIQPLRKTEKHAIDAAIEACGGNVQRAASLLKVSASTLYRKLQSWDSESVSAAAN